MESGGNGKTPLTFDEPGGRGESGADTVSLTTLRARGIATPPTGASPPTMSPSTKPYIPLSAQPSSSNSATPTSSSSSSSSTLSTSESSTGLAGLFSLPRVRLSCDDVMGDATHEHLAGLLSPLSSPPLLPLSTRHSPHASLPPPILSFPPPSLPYTHHLLLYPLQSPPCDGFTRCRGV